MLNFRKAWLLSIPFSFWPFPVFQEHVFRREHQQEDDDAEDKHEHGLDDLKYV